MPWLPDHQSVDVITRDHWAAREVAPRAKHVVVNRHLLKNLHESVERVPDRF